VNSTPYNDNYYRDNYVSPVHVKTKIAYIYYLWLALFCIIIPVRLKKGDKVLDVGCGVGNLVWALRKFGIDAHGIEPSVAAGQMSVAPTFCIYKEYKHLPFPNNHFDLVYTNEVLEHIDEKTLSSCIKDMLRVSKGKMIHMVGVTEKGPMVTKEPTHLTVRGEKWWEKEFKNLGFNVKRGNLFYFFPYFPSGTSIKGIKSGYFLLTTKPY
jgi:ubiquinone/menaquinone biosynthesis C-methylase UbiE